MGSEAARVLAELGDIGFPPLSNAAIHHNPRIRVSALNALADLVINSTNHLEASLGILSKALTNREQDTRYAALNSLRRIGVERAEPGLARRIVAVLSPLAKDGEESMRSTAEDALKQLGEVRRK